MVLKVVHEEHARLLPVADEAVKLFEEIAALHGDAHVGDERKELGAVAARQLNHLLDDLLVQVDLQHCRVDLRKDLIALFFQQIHDGQHVRPLGNGGDHVARIVKHGEPGAHAIGNGEHVIGVHLVVLQFLYDGVAKRRVIHDAQIGRPQLHIGDVLHHVARHAAVDVLHTAHVAAVGNVIAQRESFNIHKRGADNQDAHW